MHDTAVQHLVGAALLLVASRRMWRPARAARSRRFTPPSRGPCAKSCSPSSRMRAPAAHSAPAAVRTANWQVSPKRGMTGHTQFPKTSVTAVGRYSPRNEGGWLLAAPRGIARGSTWARLCIPWRPAAIPSPLSEHSYCLKSADDHNSTTAGGRDQENCRCRRARRPGNRPMFAP